MGIGMLLGGWIAQERGLELAFVIVAGSAALGAVLQRFLKDRGCGLDPTGTP